MKPICDSKPIMKITKAKCDAEERFQKFSLKDVPRGLRLAFKKVDRKFFYEMLFKDFNSVKAIEERGLYMQPCR
jgi:hypothetical protein